MTEQDKKEIMNLIKAKKLLTKTMLSDRTDGYINSKGEFVYTDKEVKE